MLKYFCHIIFLISALFLGGCVGSNPSKNKKEAETSTEELVNLAYDLERRISADPGNSDLYLEKAQLNLDSGDVETSMQAIRSALLLDSTKQEYYHFLANLLVGGREFERARAALSTAQRIAPSDALTSIKLGEVWAMEGNNDSAFHYINEGLRKDITNPYAYYLKGLLYKKLGNEERSISSFQTAIEQDPEYYEAYLELGLSLEQENPSLALQYLGNAIKSNPKGQEALANRARIYQSIDSFALAVKDLKQLVHVNHRVENAWFRLGAIYLGNNEIDSSRYFFERAAQLKSDYYQALSAIAYCYELDGNLDEAKVYYDKALDQNPAYDLALEGLERLNTD